MTDTSKETLDSVLVALAFEAEHSLGNQKTINASIEAAEQAVRRIIAQENTKAVERTLTQLKEELKQHTVPEGTDLVTQSYVNNSIDFTLQKVRREMGGSE